MRNLWLPLSLVCIAIGLSALAQQQKYALIIGVKSYQYVAPLQNSLNDARDMAVTLKGKGFTVIELYDPKTKREMQDGIKRYFSLIQNKPNAAGLVFYSGHGMQVKGVNYLIPSQADPQIEADLDDQCLDMDYVMRAIEQAGNQLNIFILDACRNNPFRGFSRSGERGLSMVETPKGSYIVYATKPGSVASDGTGRNGLFTSKLLQYINTEGLNIEQVFKQVARDVASESGDAQRPWIASDYTGDFFFTGVGIPSQAITEPIVGTKFPKAPVSTVFDYGYGPSSVATVVVGTQTWISRNLNLDHFANGDPIPEARSAAEWVRASESREPAWCYYNNDPSTSSVYGKLYNSYAVLDPRGLAPNGWHISTDEDWNLLASKLAGNNATINKLINDESFIAYETEGVGKLLKSSSGWLNDRFLPGMANGTNLSGLSCMPGGYREGKNGGFVLLGKFGCWWTSTEVTLESTWSRRLHNGSESVFRYNSTNNGDGYSVRLVKN